MDAIELNAPKWSDNPDDLCNSPPKRYCTAHHEGFHSFCRSCVQEAVLDHLKDISEKLSQLLLKP